MADIKIKDMGEALQIDNNAEFPYTQDNGGQNTTFKAKITQIASKILEAIDFSSLNTTQKKVIPAINEINTNCNNSMRCAYTSQSNLTQYDVNYDNLVAVSGRTFGMALVFAWKDIFALFYTSDSSIFIKPLTPSPNRTATVNWNSTTRNIEITFDQQVWLGISVYPV